MRKITQFATVTSFHELVQILLRGYPLHITSVSYSDDDPETIIEEKDYNVNPEKEDDNGQVHRM